MRRWWQNSSNKQKLFLAGLLLTLVNAGMIFGWHLVSRLLWTLNIVAFGLALVLPSDYEPD